METSAITRLNVDGKGRVATGAVKQPGILPRPAPESKPINRLRAADAGGACDGG
jgi:hypothetical protein